MLDKFLCRIKTEDANRIEFPSEKEAIAYCKENGIDPHKIILKGDKYVLESKKQNKSLDKALRMLDEEEKGTWITIRGSHVYIDEDGNILKGNENLKQKLKNKSNSTTAKKQENTKSMFSNIKENTSAMGHSKIADDRKAYIRNQTGISDFSIIDSFDKALESYTGDGFTEILKQQSEGKQSKEAEALEAFIKASPKFNGGTMYRSVGMDIADADKLKVGDTFDNRGAASSWTTDKTLNFLDDLDTSKKRKVTLVLASGTKHGTSIRAISEYPEEDEVLCSKEQKCKINKIEKSGDTLFVHVSEV